ncbi:MAG TPA: oligosaccharide flippase family protein [Acidobacteriaceae bacterium]|jgi:O-antigen/teichoic acid export membrane protein|nr:oligosaccharide flippase family protein [Acidobacteriaceae bacterium]
MDFDTETSAVAVEEHGDSAPRMLESRALKGTYYIVVFYGVALSLRMLSSLILSRIFLPQYFGLMALVTTVIVGLNLFSHVGVQDSVIQNPRGDEPAFINTGWTIQVIRGAGLWLLTIPLALPVAHFYREPQIVSILPVLGFTCLIAGVSSPSLLLLGRHMGVGRLSFLELFTQFVQFAVSLAWALIHPTIWALVAGRVAAELARTIVSYFMMPEIRPRFAWDRPSVHMLVNFGRWILIGTALTFLALQSDRLILAKLVSFQILGVYGIAYALSDIPRQIILQFCTRIGFPFLARFSDQSRPEFRKILLKYRLPVLAVGGVLLILVTLLGDKFVLLFYTKPYHGAAWMVAILTIGLWHTMLYSTTSPAIFSLQKAHYNAFGYLTYCIALYGALPWAFHAAGMVGAVIAVAAADIPVYFVTLYSAIREGVSTVRQDVLLTVAFLTLLVIALAARNALGFGLPFPTHLQ